MIIDAHAHCGKWFFPSHSHDPNGVADLCDRYEIEKVVFSSSKAITYDMESGNRETSEFIEHDDRFYAYVYLNPSQPEASLEQMKTYLRDPRFVGVKMHPGYSGQQANSQGTIGLLGELPPNKVLLMHTWGSAAVDRVCQLASALPDLPVIMGHMGGTDPSDWRAGIRGAQGCQNVYLEICGSLLHRDRIAEAVTQVGSERVLYGSDLTLISPAFSLGQVLDSEIGDRDKEQLLRGNAARLLHFE
jgi:predicted TIM-barrel fold metal-dependent hydrolase